MSDAFGGRGGIAQYNRDFLGAVANNGLVILVLPRRAPDPFSPGISQAAPRLGRIAYIQSALRSTLDRPVDMVFCSDLYMAPLALLIARRPATRRCCGSMMSNCSMATSIVPRVCVCKSRLSAPRKIHP